MLPFLLPHFVIPFLMFAQFPPKMVIDKEELGQTAAHCSEVIAVKDPLPHEDENIQ